MPLQAQSSRPSHCVNLQLAAIVEGQSAKPPASQAAPGDEGGFTELRDPHDRHSFEDLDEEVKALLKDRESLSSVIAAVCDSYMSRILSTEEAVRSSEKQRATKLVTSMFKEEAERSRGQVAEVMAMHEHSLAVCNELLKQLVGDEED
jgi:hypothetical protein